MSSFNKVEQALQNWKSLWCSQLLLPQESLSITSSQNTLNLAVKSLSENQPAHTVWEVASQKAKEKWSCTEVSFQRYILPPNKNFIMFSTDYKRSKFCSRILTNREEVFWCLLLYLIRMQSPTERIPLLQNHVMSSTNMLYHQTG